MFRPLAFTLLALHASVALIAAEPPTFQSFTVEVDFGDDCGQSLGSLFEARDSTGRLIAGAGFHDVYNTHFRSNPRTLQFFVRPDGASPKPVIERLPHPNLGTGVYLFDVGSNLYAFTSLNDNSVKRWDASSGEWRAELPAGVSSIRAGDGITPVGHGALTFADSEAHYDDRLILPAPDAGTRHNCYYANGYLCFYHRLAADSGAFTHVVACPWTPADGGVDLTRAIILDTKYDFESTFSWGQWNDEVITVSNSGGVYVLADGAWRVLRDPDRNVSYQVYSMLRLRDRLLLAQYPTGHVFEYRGEAVTELADWPPRPADVSSSARECQTLALYGGDLYAGVWPWAELARLDGSSPDAANWHALGRVFTHPPASAVTVHPYEADALAHSLVLNHWGQRLCSMVPLGDSLYVSTSSKGTAEWKPEYGFLSEEQRREYGAVLRLRVPGNLSAPIRWPDGPTRLQFIVAAGTLKISQDDELLVETEFDTGPGLVRGKLHVAWGDGQHGPLRGTVTAHEVKLEE